MSTMNRDPFERQPALGTRSNRLGWQGLISRSVSVIRRGCDGVWQVTTVVRSVSSLFGTSPHDLRHVRYQTSTFLQSSTGCRPTLRKGWSTSRDTSHAVRIRWTRETSWRSSRCSCAILPLTGTIRCRRGSRTTSKRYSPHSFVLLSVG